MALESRRLHRLLPDRDLYTAEFPNLGIPPMTAGADDTDSDSVRAL